MKQRKYAPGDLVRYRHENGAALYNGLPSAGDNTKTCGMITEHDIAVILAVSPPQSAGNRTNNTELLVLVGTSFGWRSADSFLPAHSTKKIYRSKHRR